MSKCSAEIVACAPRHRRVARCGRCGFLAAHAVISYPARGSSVDRECAPSSPRTHSHRPAAVAYRNNCGRVARPVNALACLPPPLLARPVLGLLAAAATLDQRRQCDTVPRGGCRSADGSTFRICVDSVLLLSFGQRATVRCAGAAALAREAYQNDRRWRIRRLELIDPSTADGSHPSSDEAAPLIAAAIEDGAPAVVAARRLGSPLAWTSNPERGGRQR